MSITIRRRGLLGLLAGIPAAIGLGRQASADGLKTIGHEIPGPDLGFHGPKPPEVVQRTIPEHPLFGVQDETIGPDGVGRIHSLRVSYREPLTDKAIEVIAEKLACQGESPSTISDFVSVEKSRKLQGARSLEIQILKQEISKARFAEIEDAEDYLFAHINFSRSSAQRSSEDPIANVIFINRAANLIAAHTRRGAGNVVLLHEDDVVRLGTRYLVKDEIPQVSRGRWKRYGTINDSIDVWTTRRLPLCFSRGMALVGYRGAEIDAGAFIAKTSTGYGVYALDHDTPSIASMLDYYETVVLDGEPEV